MTGGGEASHDHDREGPASDRPSPGPWGRDLAGLMAIIAAFFILAGSSARHKSVTFDEALHLPLGYAYLRAGEFRIEPFHSPLIRVTLALPLLASRPELPRGQGYENADPLLFGYEFMYANADRYHRLFAAPRLIAMSLGALLIVLVFGWGRRLGGSAAGLAAAALCAFDPTFMAHSQLVTADVGAAAAFFAAVLGFWAFLRRPAWPRAALAGGLVGVAILCKFTALSLPLIFPVLAAMGAGSRPAPGSRRRLWLGMALIYLAAWATVSGFYGFQGLGDPVRSYSFRSGLFKGLAARLPGGLPSPLPRDCIRGLDVIAAGAQGRERTYLLGEISDRWRPYYYLVALAAKTPLGGLAIMAAGVAWLFLAKPRRRRDDWLIALPALCLIGLVSIASRVYFGVRYLLPAIPLLYLLGSLACARCSRPRLGRAVLAAAVAGGLGSNLLNFPDDLAYFNFLAGGPGAGHRIVIDSNLDWGQDLIGLKRYMEDHGLAQICLAYYGAVDPSVYGIDYVLPQDPEQCHHLAVSVNLIAGMGFMAIKDRGLFEVPEGTFARLQDRKPTAVVGRSIWVFEK